MVVTPPAGDVAGEEAGLSLAGGAAGFDALIAGKDHVVASSTVSRVQVVAANVLPDSTGASRPKTATPVAAEAGQRVVGASLQLTPQHVSARSSPPQFHIPRHPWAVASGRGSEELEREAVRVLERQARPVVRVDDAAVVDTELVEAGLPPSQLVAVSAPER